LGSGTGVSIVVRQLSGFYVESGPQSLKFFSPHQAFSAGLAVAFPSAKARAGSLNAVMHRVQREVFINESLSALKERRMSNVESGTVKWFNDAKGFGFITPANGGEDLFAHFKEIQGTGFKTLKEGQRVEYVSKRGPKGMQASMIRPL
jgi:CspA family cold shock protein